MQIHICQTHDEDSHTNLGKDSLYLPLHRYIIGKKILSLFHRFFLNVFRIYKKNLIFHQKLFKYIYFNLKLEKPQIQHTEPLFFVYLCANSSHSQSNL